MSDSGNYAGRTKTLRFAWGEIMAAMSRMRELASRFCAGAKTPAKDFPRTDGVFCASSRAVLARAGGWRGVLKLITETRMIGILILKITGYSLD
jgi:hypothetical protein